MSSKAPSFDPSTLSTAVTALARYERRRLRIEHPKGAFDNAGRWYPRDRDAEVLDETLREPSRAWPQSYNKGCRALAHCERYEGADHDAVLYVRRTLKRLGVEATAPEAMAAIREFELQRSLPAGASAPAMARL